MQVTKTKRHRWEKYYCCVVVLSGKDKEGDEMAFAQLVQSVLALNAVIDALGWVRLR